MMLYTCRYLLFSPAWRKVCINMFICNYCSSGNCRWRENHHDVIHCDNKSSAVLDCHCVTYDEDTWFTFAGACFLQLPEQCKLMKVWSTMPSQMNQMHRLTVLSAINLTERDCSVVSVRMALVLAFVFSYNFSWMKYPDGHKKWWKC